MKKKKIKQKTERSHFACNSWVERKGFFGYTAYYMEFKGNIFKLYNFPGSKLISRVNITNCSILKEDQKSIKFAPENLILKFADQQTRETWHDLFTKAQISAKSETLKLLEPWKKEEDPSIVNFREQLEKAPSETFESTANYSTNINELLSLPVVSIENQNCTFRDILNSKGLTCICLLRHFGCMLCRRSSSKISSIFVDLSSLGISLIAIGSGTPIMASSFRREFNFPGDIYVDAKREVYKALGCNRGLKYVLSMQTLAKIKEAQQLGFKQGATQSDVLQLGGTFLIHREKGIVFQHIEEFAGDDVNLIELLNAAKEESSKL